MKTDVYSFNWVDRFRMPAQAYHRKTPCLPDRIYLINPDGNRYYSIYQGYASFEKTVPDYQCEVIVEYLPDNPEQFYLRSWEGTYFKRSTSSVEGVFVAYYTKSLIPDTIPFTLLDVRIKDTFVFRTPDGVFVVPHLQEDPQVPDKMDILSVTAQSDMAWIKVGQPVLSAAITNIEYNTDPSETTITELTPEIALSTMIRNDSTSDTITQNLTYSYLVSDVGTWSSTIGGSLATKISGKVEIPFLAEGGVEVTLTVNGSYTWGGSTTHTSVFEHFSFHGFLNLGNSKKPSKTIKNKETSELGNPCPFFWKPGGRVSHH